MKISLVLIWILINDVDANLPNRRQWFRFGQSSHDEEDYYEDEDTDEHTTPVISSIKGIKLSPSLALGATCLSMIGCGLAYHFREAWTFRERKKKFRRIGKSKINITPRKNNLRTNDRASQKDESKEKMIDQPEKRKQIDPNEIHKVDSSSSSPSSPSSTTTSSNNEPDLSRAPSLNSNSNKTKEFQNIIVIDDDDLDDNGIPLKKEDSSSSSLSSALGPYLLKVSMNGTILEPVKTDQALKGKIVVLYFSSLLAEKEIRKRKITPLLPAYHMDMARHISVQAGKPLEMIYVSLDSDVESYRDMLRALQPLKNILKVQPNTTQSNGVFIETIEDDEVNNNDDVNVLVDHDDAKIRFEDSQNYNKTSLPENIKQNITIGNYDSGSSWLAIPYGDRDTLMSLQYKFIPSQGHPHALVFNAETGQILNRGAWLQILSNTSAFPWQAPKLIDLVLGENTNDNNDDDERKDSESDDLKSFRNSDGCSVIHPTDDTITSARESAKGKRYIGLYFTADWCKPCETFMPFFAKTYAKINQRHLKNMKKGINSVNKGLEMFYVSLDRSEANFTLFRKQMPWPAIVYHGSKRSDLEQAFGVRSLPSVVILDSVTGQVVTKDARNAVMEDPLGQKFPWGVNEDNDSIIELGVQRKKQSKLKTNVDDDDDDDDEDDIDPGSTSPSGGGINMVPPKGLIEGASFVMFTDRTEDFKQKKSSRNILGNISSLYMKTTTQNEEFLFQKNLKTQQQLNQMNENDKDYNKNEILMNQISQYKLSFFLANENNSPIINAIRSLVGKMDQSSLSSQNNDNKEDEGEGQALFADLKKTKKKTKSSTTNLPPCVIILDIPNKQFFEYVGDISETNLLEFIKNVLTGNQKPKPLAVAI